MRKLSSAFLASPLPLPPARPRPPSACAPSRRTPPSVSSVSNDAAPAPQVHIAKKIPKPEAVPSTYTSLVSSASQAIDGGESSKLSAVSRVGSTLPLAISSILYMAIVSLPAMSAFRRLAASMKELSKVVSMEVPGTLSSLKLSGLEINEVTRKLSNLRQKIPGSFVKRERGRKN